MSCKKTLNIVKTKKLFTLNTLNSGSKFISSFFEVEPQEKETHTGQVCSFVNFTNIIFFFNVLIQNFILINCNVKKWEKGDYRLVRFLDKNKQVNPNWAIKLIAEVPPIPVKGRVTCCDGGSGPTGHPKVYINLVQYKLLFNFNCFHVCFT